MPGISTHTDFIPPAFAPRKDYVKLLFSENPPVNTKIRWLSDVNKAFRLDKEMAEVKMSAVTSRFVYISRRRPDIIEKAIKGEFLSLKLEVQDSIERPKKFPTYLVTRFPIGLDPSLAKELPGIHTVRRFNHHGTPINRIVITWSLPDPPPLEFNFSFLPCLPACEFRRMKDEQPWCFKCWGIGHISRYCCASDKCGFCADSHATRTCPHRAAALSANIDGVSTSEKPSTTTSADKSKWKCPRCHETGVNVWHGCTRRTTSASLNTNAMPQSPVSHQSHPPPAPSQPLSSLSSTSSHPQNKSDHHQVSELRDAITSLTTSYKLLSNRYDAFEVRMNEFAAQQVSTEIKLSTLVEGQHSLIAAFSTLSEKFDAITIRLEKIERQSNSSSSPSPGTRSDMDHATSSRNGSRKAKRRT